MGGEFHCNYEETTGTLEIKKNTLFHPEFFFLPTGQNKQFKIKNVTGIVGENGAGKSTILNYIKDISGAMYRACLIEAIIVVRDYSGDLIVYSHENCPIKDIKNSTEKKAIPMPINKLDFKNTNVVFYSSVFDLQIQEHIYHGPLRNISTNYLIREDGRGSSFSVKDAVEFHKTKELERQVRFVSSTDARYIDKALKLPEELNIFVQDVEMNMMYDEMKRFPATEFFKNLIKNLKSIQISYEENSQKDIEKYSFMKNLLVRTVQQLFLEMGRFNLIHILEKKFRSFDRIKTNNLYDKVFIWMKLVLNNLGKNEPGYSFLEGLIKILYYFDVNIWNGNLKITKSGVTIPMNGDKQLFKEFYKHYLLTIGDTSILELDWRDLSSGEKALLNLYARFYSLVDEEENKFNKLEKNVVVLIDEGELYFHPQWQKRFLLDILNFLSDIFSRNAVQAIQIIITSNSPFIVSDLPSSHIIFLKKDSITGSVVVKLEDYQQTFSANIHNLLSHSFFMENGTIGEFAKQKINNTIHLLINGSIEEIQNNRIEIEYLISIIGEPIIRNQMISLLEDRLSIMPLNLEERVRLLEKEIQDLKSEVNL